MTNVNTDEMVKLFSTFKEEIKEEFRHQLGIQTESFQHKLELVVEGHQMLAEKMGRMEKRLDGRIDCVIRKLDAVAAQGDATAMKLELVAAQGDATAAKLDTVASKLDAVAADLKAHRADTEAHPPLYRIKE